MKFTELNFPSRDKALVFAKNWSRFTLRGYSLSSKKGGASTTVTITCETDAEAIWVDVNSGRTWCADPLPGGEVSSLTAAELLAELLE
jgi:hypothetical protein